MDARRGMMSGVEGRTSRMYEVILGPLRKYSVCPRITYTRAIFLCSLRGAIVGKSTSVLSANVPRTIWMGNIMHSVRVHSP